MLFNLTLYEWILIGSGIFIGFGIGVFTYWYFIRKPILKKKPYDKERKKWDDLLHKAHNEIPVGPITGSRQTDMQLLDLYLRKKNDDALFWHNIIILILTGSIVLLTTVNIWLNT